MDQLLRLNEETLKWHVLCQLLSSSVLERLLKTMCEVYPSFNADATLVARLYHETEQACLDVVRNFILIGETNKLLQNTGSSSPQPSYNASSPPSGLIKNGIKSSPNNDALQSMRRLAPKPNSLAASLIKQESVSKIPTSEDSSSLKSTLVNQINQNIQMQLKQLSQSDNSSFTPAQSPTAQLSPTQSNHQILPETAQLLTAHLAALQNQQKNQQNGEVVIKKEPESTPTPQFNGGKPVFNNSSENVPTEPLKFERQVSDLKNYMNEVKALFDVFNDPSPKTKEAVNALSHAISVNNVVAQGLSNIIKMESEMPQLHPTPHTFFPIQPQPIPAVDHYKKSSKEKLNCKDCGQMFQYTYQMERHIATRHSYIKKIICDICKKTFGSPGALKRHHETIHQKIKRFTCEDCGKKFGRKDHMKFHISTVHSQKKEQQALEQSIIDAAITQAKQTVEKKRADDPLDELKQRIRDMSENHAKEVSIKQQLQAQQHIFKQQQQLQHQLLQHQQQHATQQQFDLTTVLNTINANLLKSSASPDSPPKTTITNTATSINGNHAPKISLVSDVLAFSNQDVPSKDVTMAEDDENVDVEDFAPSNTRLPETEPTTTLSTTTQHVSTTPTTQFNSEVQLEAAKVSQPTSAPHVTVT